MRNLMVVVVILLVVVFAGCSTSAVKHEIPIVMEKPSEPFVPDFGTVTKVKTGYAVEYASVPAMYEGKMRHVDEEEMEATLLAEFKLATRIYTFIGGYVERSSKNMTKEGQAEIRRVVESGIRKYASAYLTGVEEIDKVYSKDFCTIVKGINTENLKKTCELTIKSIKKELADERDKKVLELEHKESMQKLDELMRGGGKLSDNTQSP